MERQEHRDSSLKCFLISSRGEKQAGVLTSASALQVTSPRRARRTAGPRCIRWTSP